MATYRVGNHQPRNVYRGDQYIGVMFTAENAALVVEALNGISGPCPASVDTPLGTPLMHRCELPAGHAGDHKDAGMRWWEATEDSCTCPFLSGANPACPVHQGRRARGPKPPPPGPGCICDGSGRTCPRHGAVM